MWPSSSRGSFLDFRMIWSKGGLPHVEASKCQRWLDICVVIIIQKSVCYQNLIYYQSLSDYWLIGILPSSDLERKSAGAGATSWIWLHEAGFHLAWIWIGFLNFQWLEHFRKWHSQISNCEYQWFWHLFYPIKFNFLIEFFHRFSSSNPALRTLFSSG